MKDISLHEFMALVFKQPLNAGQQAMLDAVDAAPGDDIRMVHLRRGKIGLVCRTANGLYKYTGDKVWKLIV